MAVNYSELKAGGFMRQKQKNCFSMRLATTGGHVSAEELAAILEVAEKYGHGYIHLTSRQGIEIPFIQLKDIEDVKKTLAKGGARNGVCGPRVRTITACQGDETCPNGCIATQPLANELAKRYFGKELPHKFKFGVTGCQNNCLKAEENDLGIKGGIEVTWKEEDCIGCGVCVKACRKHAITLEDGKITIDYDKCNNCGRCYFACPTSAYEGEHGYMLSFGGLFGNTITKGESFLPFIHDHDTLMRVCDACINWFKDNAKPSERFYYTIQRVGKDSLIKTLKEAYNG